MQLIESAPARPNRRKPSVIASKRRLGRVIVQCRRGFIAANGKATSASDLVRWCHPAAPTSPVLALQIGLEGADRARRYSTWQNSRPSRATKSVGTECRTPATDRTLSGVWKNPSEIALLAIDKIKGF